MREKKTTFSQVYLIFFHKIAKFCFFWNFFILINSTLLQFRIGSIHCLLATVVSCWFHLFNQSHACTLEIYNSWKFFSLIFQKNCHISKYLQVIWILPASFLQIHHHFHFGHFGHVVRCSHLSHVQVAWISSFRICCCCIMCLQSQELVLLEQLSQLTTSLLAIISKVITSLFVACYGMNMSVVCGLLWNEHNAFAN